MSAHSKTICIIDGDLAERLASGFYRMADLLEETFQKSKQTPLGWDDVTDQVMACVAAQDEILRARGEDPGVF